MTTIGRRTCCTRARCRRRSSASGPPRYGSWGSGCRRRSSRSPGRTSSMKATRFTRSTRTGSGGWGRCLAAGVVATARASGSACLRSSATSAARHRSASGMRRCRCSARRTAPAGTLTGRCATAVPSSSRSSRCRSGRSGSRRRSSCGTTHTRSATTWSASTRSSTTTRCGASCAARSAVPAGRGRFTSRCAPSPPRSAAGHRARASTTSTRTSTTSRSRSSSFARTRSRRTS